MLSQPGFYVFDLEVGFNTKSSLKVDGQSLSSPGMCRVTPNRAACEAKGCLWLPDKAECLPAKKATASLLQIRVPAPAPHPGSAFAPSASSSFAPAAAPAASPAAAETEAATGVLAYSPASDAFPVLAPTKEAEVSEEEQEVVLAAPQPAPAPAPFPEPQSAAFSPAGMFPFPPAAMPDVVAEAAPPAAPPAPAPAPQLVISGEVDETAGTVMLKSGGHCVEVNVMVTPSARSLALRYKGPDTSGKMTTVPGQVLFCDPVLSACEDAGPNTCVNFA